MTLVWALSIFKPDYKEGQPSTLYLLTDQLLKPKTTEIFTHPIHQLSCIFKMFIDWRVSHVLELGLGLLKILFVFTLEPKKSKHTNVNPEKGKTMKIWF